MVYLRSSICCQDISKIAKSGHTVIFSFFPLVEWSEVMQIMFLSLLICYGRPYLVRIQKLMFDLPCSYQSTFIKHFQLQLTHIKIHTCYLEHLNWKWINKNSQALFEFFQIWAPNPSFYLFSSISQKHRWCAWER